MFGEDVEPSPHVHVAHFDCPNLWDNSGWFRKMPVFEWSGFGHQATRDVVSPIYSIAIARGAAVCSHDLS